MVLVIVTLGPLAWRPDPAGNADLDRLLGFLVAGLTLGIAFPRARLRAAAGLAMLAAALEVAQALVPGRDPALADLLIKLAGGLTGVAATAASALPRSSGRADDAACYSRRRVAAMVVSLSFGIATAAWWLDAPVAATRALHARLLAHNIEDDLGASGAAGKIGKDPVVDIWNRDVNAFSATVRRADCAGPMLLVRFRRHGWSWQALNVRVAPARVPSIRPGCKSGPSHS